MTNSKSIEPSSKAVLRNAIIGLSWLILASSACAQLSAYQDVLNYPNEWSIQASSGGVIHTSSPDATMAAYIADFNAHQVNPAYNITLAAAGPCVPAHGYTQVQSPYSGWNQIFWTSAICPVTETDVYLATGYTTTNPANYTVEKSCPYDVSGPQPNDGNCVCQNRYGGGGIVQQLYVNSYDIGYTVPWSNSPVHTGACLATREYDRTKKTRPKQCYGNPIYPINGTKREVLALGLQLQGLDLKLTYDSSALVPTSGAGAQRLPPPRTQVFGTLWASSAHERLLFNAQYVLAQRSDGTVVPFTSSAGIFTADPDVTDQLTSLLPSGYRYVDTINGVIETYAANGLVLSTTNTSGQVVTYTYSDSTTPVNIAPGPDYLIQVQDAAGRSINFEYEPRGVYDVGYDVSRVARVKDPAGNYVQFGYSSDRQLSSVTWQDGKNRQFLYEMASLPSALTGVVNELGVRQSTFAYDPSGYATSTQLAGGVLNFSASYQQPPSISVSETYDSTVPVIIRTITNQAPAAAVITTPNGASLNLSATVVQGTPLVTGKSQPAGSGCAPSTNAVSYDANGNATTEDDFNGNRSCSVYDATRNVQTVRVDGLPNTSVCSAVTASGAALPTGSAKTSTAYHPNWRLPKQVSRPRKLTTIVYNGQPDPFNGNVAPNCAASAPAMPNGSPIAVVCKTVEQATTDADGRNGLSATIDTTVPSRINSYTYNQFGSVLTQTDPRNFTTTYNYYTDSTGSHKVGDLQSITNAVGKTITFDSYDASGRLLSATDERGATTAYAYDARGRLLSSSVAGLVTAYTYDNAGRLTVVTLPDASTLTYTFDDANRVTGVSDGAGNTVTYVLDNEGHVTSEQWKDSAGVLAKSVTRVYDALSRLQSVTGAAQ